VKHLLSRVIAPRTPDLYDVNAGAGAGEEARANAAALSAQSGRSVPMRSGGQHAALGRASPTVLVNLRLDRSNSAVYRAIEILSRSLGVHVRGVVACRPMEIAYGAEFLVHELYLKDRDNIVASIAAVESTFRQEVQKYCQEVDWRMSLEVNSVADYLCLEARAADIIVVGSDDDPFLGGSRVASVGDVVLNAGRPVLVVPPDVSLTGFGRVIVCWKDTREARRAVADALRLLRAASDVLLVEIVDVVDRHPAELRLAEVSKWLARHGIESRGVAKIKVSDIATELLENASEFGAELIVAGAFGHSPLRERVLGGVTSRLLESTGCCLLMSH
jgi:nucleotide-binding universal stress UspA family protein